MVSEYAVVLTGFEDPMWPFLYEAGNEEEKENLALFPTDRPDCATLQYSPINGEVIFRLKEKSIRGSEVQGIWLRRLVPPNFDHFERDLKEYCITEYNFFYEGLEYALPNIVWVSKPSAISKAQNKAFQLSLAQKLGFLTLGTIFTNSPATFAEIPKIDQTIYKAVRSPRIPLSKEMHSTVFTTKLSEEHLAIKNRIISCPGILQRFCPKIADIRATVFGDSIFAVKIDSQKGENSKIDFRNGAKLLDHSPYELPADISEKCLHLIKEMGLLYGAIDFALLENGDYVFFEINPNGQWGWLEQKCNLPMRRALLNILFQKGNQ
jgi:glutathione synthase/RimK-type ligase-like ATP-grasp enzyme